MRVASCELNSVKGCAVERGQRKGESGPGGSVKLSFALHVHVALSSCAALGCFTRRLSFVVCRFCV